MGEHPDESALLDFSAGRMKVAASDALVDHLDTCSRCRQMLSSLTQSTSSDELEAVSDASDQATRVGVDMLVGQQVGEYRILERINQGGMGVLYRGLHPIIGKPVAIKVLLPELAADTSLVHRLLGEARAVNSIRHANIVDIFALGQLPDGRHYMVMELLEGQSLAEMLRERGKLTPAEVLVVLEQVMGALQAAHAAGVIHRDLKPENLFVSKRQEGWHVTLLDFGLAKQRGALSHLTAPNVVLGTPGYMAPEQIRGEPATPAIDLYAMGIVAWALLVGREPYTGGSIVDVMKRHLEAPIPAVRTVLPNVPASLENLIQRLMSKEPGARPTAEEVRKLLIRQKNDSRRFVIAEEKTQLVQPETVPEGVRPVPAPQPATIPQGVKPVPKEPATLSDTTLPPPNKNIDPSLLTTRPDRLAPTTLVTAPVMEAFIDSVPMRRAPWIIAAIGVVLILGAIGLLFL